MVSYPLKRGFIGPKGAVRLASLSSLFNENAVMILARILAFVTAIPFHEAAHAFVSDKLGDPTAREMGRLSLNPLRHLDPLGFLAMLIIGVGWAKPVPVHPERYKNPRVGMALSAVAGPAANLLLAYINVILYKVSYYGGALAGYSPLTPGAMPFWLNALQSVLWFLAVININLAVFNMLPIPPFDGSRLFGLLLPERVYNAIARYERFIMFAVLILLWFGFLSNVLTVLNRYAMMGMDLLTGYVDMLFVYFAR